MMGLSLLSDDGQDGVANDDAASMPGSFGPVTPPATARQGSERAQHGEQRAQHGEGRAQYGEERAERASKHREDYEEHEIHWIGGSSNHDSPNYSGAPLSADPSSPDYTPLATDCYVERVRRPRNTSSVGRPSALAAYAPRASYPVPAASSARQSPNPPSGSRAFATAASTSRIAATAAPVAGPSTAGSGFAAPARKQRPSTRTGTAKCKNWFLITRGRQVGVFQGWSVPLLSCGLVVFSCRHQAQRSAACLKGKDGRVRGR